MAIACPRLAELPDPPLGKVGWPWTEEAAPFPALMPSGHQWPTISIITPSFNQDQFIEQTIRSVLLQGYPRLEYIIIDGASQDSSTEIIRKYEKHLAYWVSETDRGQSHAINKGFMKSTGRILCWLNSDDYYLPGTLKIVAENLSDTSAIVAHMYKAFDNGSKPLMYKGSYENQLRLLQFWKPYQMHQSSIFWRREVFEKVGLLNENLHYTMDYDYWVRISKHFNFKTVDQVLSCVNYHSQAKTGDGYIKYHQELRNRARQYWGSPTTATFWRLQVSMLRDLVVRSALSKIRRLFSK